jgi:hypothetical protein
MFEIGLGAALAGLAVLLYLAGRRLWWRWQSRRHPSVASATRYAVWHTQGTVRRLYHESDDPRTAKAHFYANNAPRGTTVELYDRGKFRGRRRLA